jgi:hypothetical protein
MKTSGEFTGCYFPPQQSRQEEHAGTATLGFAIILPQHLGALTASFSLPQTMHIHLAIIHLIFHSWSQDE